MSQDLRWAWRNLHARGSRPLLAVALAANALVFAAADSLVFHRTPYPDFEQLIEIRQRDAPPAARWDVLPRRFSTNGSSSAISCGVEGIFRGPFFWTHRRTCMVPDVDVTVGLIDLLGARPRWGRAFIEDDARQADAQSVLIAESLATEQFGDPSRAVGQRLQTTGEPLVVVGVMPADFRFPTGTVRIWRALDPRGPLTGGSCFRIVTPRAGRDLTRCRRHGASEPDASIGRSRHATPRARAAASRPGRDRPSADMLVLVGAALSFAIGLSNVGSLELQRVRPRSHLPIQLAVGRRAPRSSARAFEGSCCWRSDGARGGDRSRGATRSSRTSSRTSRRHANPIDDDERALLFLVAIAAAACAVAARPWPSRDAELPILLNLECSSSPRRAEARVSACVPRPVRLAVRALGTVLYLLVYMRCGPRKVFDSVRLYSVSLTIPPQTVRHRGGTARLAETSSHAILAPGVVLRVEGAPPPDARNALDPRTDRVDDRCPMPATWFFRNCGRAPTFYGVAHSSSAAAFRGRDPRPA